MVHGGKRMRSWVVAGFSVCVVYGTGASAQSDRLNITPQEHAACDNDAARLCSDAYPDENKLLDCMNAKRAQLTPRCSTTFDAGLRKRHIEM